MPSLITAGDASNGISFLSANDNSLVIQTGAAGAKVNAVSFAADGTPVFLKQPGSSMITSGTAQATTSGTSIDFTGIPSWVKRITVNFAGTSTAGSSSAVLIQLGTSGGIQNTGYLSTTSAINNANTTVVSNFTAGVSPWTGAIASIVHGSVVITLLNSAN